MGHPLLADNYATHNHPKIKAWLATRPRWHMHFIPTYSSWLNQIERFFSLITDKAKWTSAADSILEKLHRLCSRISGTGH